MSKKALSVVSYVSLGVLFILWDQLTKQWALVSLANRTQKMFSWLKLRLVFNRGVSWGMFSSDNQFVFWGVTAAIIAITFVVFGMAIVSFMRRQMVLGQVLIVAGSISNLIDRFVHKAVIDFVAVTYDGWSWPFFNMADTCIVLGAIILFFTYDQRC